MREVTISATEANRSFSRLLRMAREGCRIRITSHGRTAAVLSPPERDEEAERQRRKEALAELQRHWAETEPLTVGPWTRDELYERGSWKKWQR